jgi:uncharacterized protein
MNRLTLLLLVLAAAKGQEIRFDTLMVSMRDGVKLATDIYRPVGEGRHPVLVTRSPYNKNGERKRGQFFARHGYVFVAQDCRGRWASEGMLYPMVNEGRDGYDTIEWAAAQPWSDGQVGSTGASYLAMDQYAAAIERPPHLVAMYAAVGSQNYYYDSAYPGGLTGLGWPVWILYSASTDPKLDKAQRDRLAAILKKPDEWLSEPRPKRAEVFANLPEQKRVYDDFVAHPQFDAYWKQTGFDTADYYDRFKDVPILFLSGWYDSFADATLKNFVALSKMQKAEKRLIMGPWPHGYGKSLCGDAEFGPQAVLDEDALQLDWFDHWMKKRPFQVLGTDPVRYYRMGGKGGKNAKGHLTPGGEWKTAAAWPPAQATRERWPIAIGSYAYDPKNPVHTNGGREGPTCIQNQIVNAVAILTTISDPLKTPMDVTGAVTATLSILSDAPSTDLVIRLIDVYPDGYAAILLEGAKRISGSGTATVNLGTTSNLFARGHRVRIDVTSSSFPKYEPNPNPAHVQIKAGSYVELPTVPGPPARSGE